MRHGPLGRVRLSRSTTPHPLHHQALTIPPCSCSANHWHQLITYDIHCFPLLPLTFNMICVCKILQGPLSSLRVKKMSSVSFCQRAISFLFSLKLLRSSHATFVVQYHSVEPHLIT